MEDKEQILTGQGEQQNIPRNLDVSVANDLLGEVQSKAQPTVKVGASVGKYGTGAGAKPVVPKQTKSEQKKIAAEQFVGGMSGRIKSLINSPGFTGDNGMYDTTQIQNRRNIAYIPELYEKSINKDVEYREDFTSGTGTIVKDSVKQFWMGLGTLGDKAMIGLGGITSKITGGEFGTEMRDRAYESLEAKLYNIGLESTHVADVETLTSKITMGATSILEMIAVGAMTGGIAPIAQMSVDVFGDGTYNNMRRYANENGGTIDGYEGNWADIGVDLGNAALQAVIEKKLGVGSSRFYRGTGGHFIKEGLEGFFQESSQEFLGDFAEYVKGNQEAGVMLDRWQDYLTAGVIGGVMQGSLGAATYKASRSQVDNAAQQMYVEVVGRANPNIAEEKLQKDGRAFAKAINDDVEKGIARDMYQELVDRADANNDRGRIRESLVVELTKAKASSLGLENTKELDAQDLADIQDAATVLARESVRIAWAQGVPMADTLMGRVYADGATLKIRDLTPSERGVQIKHKLDISADNEVLASAISEGRAKEKARSEKSMTDELIKSSDARANQSRDGRISQKVAKVSQRQVELGLRGRADGKTVKQIETNIKAQTDQVLQDFVEKQYGYANPRYFSRGKLEDLALRQKNNWGFISPAARETGEEVAQRLGVRSQQRTVERVLDQDARDLTSYAGVPVSTIESMSDAEYNAFVAEQSKRRANEMEIERARQQDGLQNVEDIEYQQSLKNAALSVDSDTGRGSYDSRYQEIILNKNSDISTILHEFSHLFLNTYFKAARAENAPEGFRKMWGAVEKGLGIRPYERFLDKEISEKFARGFEKFVADGGKGASDSMKNVYERLSKRMADIYDDLATRYFDQVGELKPAVQSWFAMNEVLADSLYGPNEPINRAKEREDAIDQAKTDAQMQGNATAQTVALNNAVEKAEPAPLAVNSDEPMASPYTVEGQKERTTSKNIRNMATAEGILVDARSEYNPYESARAAEDARMLTQMDYELAKDIAMGRKPSHGGIAPETMFIAVRNQALLNNDANTLKMLQLSPVQARITEAAQRLSLVRNYTGNGEQNIVKLLNDFQKVYDAKISDKTKTEIAEQVAKLNELIKQFDMDSEQTWGGILNNMECK